MAGPFLHLTPISCSVEGFLQTTCVPSRQVSMTRAAPRHDNHHRLGPRTKEATPQREIVMLFIIQPHFPDHQAPIPRALREITQGLRWLQSRLLSSSMCGKCLSNHLLSSFCSLFLVVMFSPGAD